MPDREGTGEPLQRVGGCLRVAGEATLMLRGLDHIWEEEGAGNSARGELRSAAVQLWNWVGVLMWSSLRVRDALCVKAVPGCETLCG